MSTYAYTYERPQSPWTIRILSPSAVTEDTLLNHLAILVVQAMLISLLGLSLKHATPAGAQVISPISPDDVAGAHTTVMIDDEPLAEVTPPPTPEPAEEPTTDQPTTGQTNQLSPLPHPDSNPTKESYTIAIMGDSIIDTVGERTDYLEHALAKVYHNVQFKLYNYGKGSTNVEEGLASFHQNFSYQTRNYPPIDKIDADIIIVGSYGYNPKSPHDRNWHWLGLTHLIQEAQKTGADVYVLAEIAPLREDFGKGDQGVNWETQTAVTHSGHIIQQLQNAIGLSKTLGVPLIDAFTPSLTAGQPDGPSDGLAGKPAELAGRPEYVDPADNIHPSIAGHEFLAEIIVTTLVLH